MKPKPNKYQVLDYRSPAEVSHVLSLIASVAAKNESGESMTVEQTVKVPTKHTRQGKGQRRKAPKRKGLVA